MRFHPEFTYEVLSWITLNWTMPSQIKVSVAKSSREICTLFQYYAAHGGNTNISGQYFSLKFKEIQK